MADLLQQLEERAEQALILRSKLEIIVEIQAKYLTPFGITITPEQWANFTKPFLKGGDAQQS